MQIIPAIDLRGGKCVRLRQGDFADETVFGNDPAAMAAHWVAQGARRLHIVDLDGALLGQPRNLDSVRAILDRVKVPCQFGGGVRSRETVETLVSMGVDRVVIGTRALVDARWFQTLCAEFPGRIALGLDARNGHVATEGWTQTSPTLAIDLARQFSQLPIAAIIYTDIGRDGMMGGVNIDSVREVVNVVDSPVIASGGVTTLRDIEALVSLRLAGCIVGRALYEGTIELADAIRISS